MFPTKADFILIPHSALHLVEEVSIDLAINTLSFAEMPPSAIAGDADFIARHLSETGISAACALRLRSGEDETYRASPGGRCPIRSISP